MSIFKKSKKNKACVIGLDGVPYSMLTELARKGAVTTVARLMDSGHLHRMKASLPEISAVSWTNFMTGENPGVHGIFGFTDFKPDSYGIRFPNFLDLKTETFWDVLGKKNKKCIVLNQPSTYPARKINGVLVSGFVAIDLAKAVYPHVQMAALEQMGYQIDIDTLRARDNPGFLWQELAKTMAGHQKALNYFWEEDWDYFEFVITGTDRLHHFLWNAYQDDGHPFHENFIDYYRQVDRVISKIAASFRKMTGGEEGLYILSDHGFTGIEQEVYLNAWLEQEGYLKFSKPDPEGLESIAPKTLAFALDPNRIYLNLKKRFPRGIVDASEKKALKEEISGKLLKLEYQGKKVVRRVFFGEDIYAGPLLPKAPDLIVLGEPGFDMKGSTKKKEVFGRTSLQGMHTWDDAFFLADSRFGEDLEIADLAKIILRNFS
ncbi:MAG TPA: alkaline phosphatase family protein [Candidatus Aminicenantes bacterium]|nr:alkaline phosphatase family protein [Acidobacteriota bacterium]HOI45785.1 alkaline phosphatase family protein [Candidatus Aminicenantes bacterium]